MDTTAVKQKLTSKLDELRNRLARVARDVSRAHSSDSAEQAQERENDEVLDEIGNETRVAISQIESALERIESGNYGSCERCGEQISLERLQFLPEAVSCINCAE